MTPAPSSRPPPAGTAHGRFFPQGATFDGHGVNFALYSEHATRVELCLFDAEGRETRIPVPYQTVFVWHVYVIGVLPGQRYGYRVYGPYDPARGLRFNPNKLLIDPYAKMFAGKVSYEAPVFAYPRDRGAGDSVMDLRDDAAGVPKSVVAKDSFDWGGDSPPLVPWRDTVVYELHVKGFTKLHPDIPEELRGTYLGLASPEAIRHLKQLGITTVELMPIQESMDEPEIALRGRTNYWGYSPLGYFAPDQRFASRKGGQIHEVKQMVRELHRAGIEVVLDVVYNHTGEGSGRGPTVGLRGIDNTTYYRLERTDLSLYEDYSGCGNALRIGHPQTLKLVMDSLRYWVTEMHVDGFRFDLASALGRDERSAHRMASFFDTIHQDPLLSHVKLIAEPWDLGEGGYQVGNFPLLWAEWNGRYRDTVRRFWKGEKRGVSDMGYRLTGSSDLFGDDGRHPHASINFITAHDGFTLRDLVSYKKKHNEANGEENRDGGDHDESDNCGKEGETDDPLVIEERARRRRALMATLLLSQGVPMLSMGDEIGRTQGGNNNAYCQDNETSWVDWRKTPDSQAFLEFTKKLLALRNRNPTFRRRDFLRGHVARRTGIKDIVWLREDGTEMEASDWQAPERPFIGFRLDGDTGPTAPNAQRGNDPPFLVYLNAGPALTVTLPDSSLGACWIIVVDTAKAENEGGVISSLASLTLPAGSLVLLEGDCGSATR